MSKQEVIRKAYGEYWETYKSIIDENGWFSNRFTGNDIPNSQLDFKTEKEDKKRPFRFRIKSLAGIENNNGWTVADIMNLPKEGVYQVGKFLDDGTFRYGIDEVEWDELREYLIDFGFTHYQPITKPLKPIY